MTSAGLLWVQGSGNPSWVPLGEAARAEWSGTSRSPTELQDMGGGPGVSGVWRRGCSYGTQGWRQNKASSDTQGDESHPGCLGLEGFPGRVAFCAKAGKSSAN